MRKTFTRSLLFLGGMFVTLTILFFTMIILGEESIIGQLLLNSSVFLLCASPLVMLVTVFSGLGLLWQSATNTQKKKKSEYSDLSDFSFDSDDEMDAIMARLTPEQQDFLQEKLAKRELGLGADGEIVSMNDLLDEFESKKKRSID